MQIYLNLLDQLLTHGTKKADRTETGTISLFGAQLRFNLSHGFPVVTTKKIHLKSVIHELLWFLNGDTNITYLQNHGVTIWNEWADKDGNLGPIYGHQWRSWSTPNGNQIDQISSVVDEIKKSPNSRRLIVTAWNPSDMNKMALPPCHILFQFYVANNTLSCQLYQRSADYFLGVPFNIASYALLTHMMAQQTNLTPGELIWTGGDVHLYTNHITQAKIQLSRTPYVLPSLHITHKPNSIFEYHYEDFVFTQYQSHPPLKAPIAV